MPISLQDIQHSRRGAIYLWQGTEHTSPLAQTVISGALGVGSGIAGYGDINIALPDQTTDFLQFVRNAERDPAGAGKVWKSVLSWSESLMNQILTKLKEIFTDVFEIGVHVKKVALWVAQMVYAESAPYIGGGATLVSGLVKAGTAFVERTSVWLAGRSVKLNAGHPETLVSAIETGINRSMLDGIYDIARSAISMNLTWTGNPSASLIDMIAAAIDAAYKILWRILESHAITKFCNRARELWAGRDSRNGGVRRGATFNKWMLGGVSTVPVIAAVTLASGLTGDKMRFLNMFTDQDAVITQGQFDKGCDYLEQIKRSASRMIAQSEIEFASSDKLIDGLLTLAKNANDEASPTLSWWGYWGLDKIFRS